MTAKPTVSVVLPTYNRLPILRRVLQGLATQSLDKREFEVVVVSDGSTDRTDEWLRSSEVPLPLIALTQSNGGPAAARNHGISAARGSLVVFLDDDVVPGPALLETHVRAHRGCAGSAVVIGPMLTPDDFVMSPWARWEQAMLYKQYHAMLRGDWAPTWRQFYTGNASIERALLLEVGGFDPSFRRAEDVELAYRVDQLGVSWIFEPHAEAYHYARRGFDAWLATAAAYGRNDAFFTSALGREQLLPTIREEFDKHHVLVRAVTRVGLRMPATVRPMQLAMRAAASVASRCGATRAAQYSLSGMYNLTYFHGLAEGLGDADAFWSARAHRRDRSVAVGAQSRKRAG